MLQSNAIKPNFSLTETQKDNLDDINFSISLG